VPVSVAKRKHRTFTATAAAFTANAATAALTEWLQKHQ
jgi:hypothetical protein